MAAGWDGKDRRSARDMDMLKQELSACKREVDREIDGIHQSVQSLREEVHGLRSDMHRVAESVGSIQTSLETIASTVSKLADWPDTWNRIQGFWAVVRWMRANFLPLSIVLGIFFYFIYVAARSAGAPLP